jgi:4-diphosphocytidyl-2-C-methyl-D-erythritol kinase
LPTRVSVRAFAKINLGLKVLSRRPDGYHEIRTVYQTVDLHDRLTVSLAPGRRDGGLILEADSPAVPAGRENIVCRAWELWRRARNFAGSARVRLEKRIPVGAGLGGGSADAAATLLGLERLTADRLPALERLRLAARLGSDVPFFLWGGRGLGCGRGEEVYPLGDLPRRHCLLVFPGFPVSTAEAYARLDSGRRLTNRGRSLKMNTFGAWSPFSLENWGPAENDFERVVFARWPGLARVKQQLIRAGAETASLTGSGSALYAVFVSARKLQDACGEVPAGWKVFVARSLSRAASERRRFFSAR